MHRAIAILRRLNLVPAWAGGAGILAITVFTLYGVFTRYVLRGPDIWTYPVCSYLLLLVAFLATGQAYEKGDHVRVDNVLQRLPPRARRACEAVCDAGTLIFLAVLLVEVCRVFGFSLRAGRTDDTMLAWPLAAVQWVMPLGAATLFLAHVAQMAERYLAPPPAGAEGGDPARG